MKVPGVWVHKDRQEAILHAVTIYNLHNALGFAPVDIIPSKMGQILHL